MISCFKHQRGAGAARLARSIALAVFCSLVLFFALSYYSSIQSTEPVDLPSYTLRNVDYLQSINDPFAFRSVHPPNEAALDSYPPFSALGELLTAWPANYVELDGWRRSLSHPSQSGGLYRLDYLDPTERRLAIILHDQELPFILYNVPDLDKAAERQFSLSSLRKAFGDIPYTFEKSDSNEFLYFMVKNRDSTMELYPDWRQPQEHVQMTFDDFLQAASQAQSYNLSTAEAGREFYYLTLSATAGGALDWISSALPFFKYEDSLFVQADQPYHGKRLAIPPTLFSLPEAIQCG